MRRMLKRYTVVLLVLTCLTFVTGCQTMSGLGSDVKKAGKGIGKLFHRGEKPAEKKSE